MLPFFLPHLNKIHAWVEKARERQRMKSSFKMLCAETPFCHQCGVLYANVMYFFNIYKSSSPERVNGGSELVIEKNANLERTQLKSDL